ncbi:3,4-dihydroxyphenylacetaldehyde synthase 2-like [Planococcus citri]|uniref:3,4-dihydroxyphenylacetaldehyde synthase 2-like n=1 Tax=Planococcus citri TaxID=170843 RepID=UPI0031F8AF17
MDLDSKTFREFGYAAIDYVANYVDTIRERSVLPDVQPGYLSELIPDEIPEEGEPWTKLMEDFDKHIMPGITHWQSPQFHAFFPTGTCYPSMIGELISAALGIIGLHWQASPACTELEVMTMNWLGKLINLPSEFLNCSSGPGGGIIQGSASETTFLCLLVAKSKTIKRIKKLHPEMSESEIAGKLVAYTSDQANSSVEKAGILGSIKMRLLPTGEDGKLLRETLIQVFENDCNQGLFPCYMVATLGSTGICTSDELQVIGPLCEKYNIWLHVDAAYAGAALVLPECQHLLNGVEHANSFNFNPHKWLLVNFDCSALWLKNANDLSEGLAIERIYLKDNENVNTQSPEYRNWQIPLGRRFRALKLWFTLKSYGKKGLQAFIRHHINLANLFASLVDQDSRFELACPTRLGLVCFRLKGDNKLTEELHNRLMLRRNIYTIVATVNGQLIIRFVVCSRLTTEADINFAWNEIRSQADELLADGGKPQLNGHSLNGANLNGNGHV